MGKRFSHRGDEGELERGEKKEAAQIPDKIGTQAALLHGEGRNAQL